MSETRVPLDVKAACTVAYRGLRLLDDKRNGRELEASVRINRAFAHFNSFAGVATSAMSSVKQRAKGLRVSPGCAPMVDGEDRPWGRIGLGLDSKPTVHLAPKSSP